MPLPRHSEQRLGEVFLGNFTFCGNRPKEGCCGYHTIIWMSKRRGMDAYNDRREYLGNENPPQYPVFVSRNEFRRYGINPDSAFRLESPALPPKLHLSSD